MSELVGLSASFSPTRLFNKTKQLFKTKQCLGGNKFQFNKNESNPLKMALSVFIKDLVTFKDITEQQHHVNHIST